MKQYFHNLNSGAAFPTLPWCVGPLSGPIPQSSFPPESPFEEVPNDLNILESVQENTSKKCFQEYNQSPSPFQFVKRKEFVSP